MLVVVSFPFFSSFLRIHIRIFEFTSYSPTTFNVIMRSSTIVAFMLPLTALAAPTLVERQINKSGLNSPVLKSAGTRIFGAFGSSKNALASALSTANSLGESAAIGAIRKAQGKQVRLNWACSGQDHSVN